MNTPIPRRDRKTGLYDPAAHQTSKVVWAVSQKPVPYEAAVSVMEARVARIAARQADEMVWLLEHPPIYTSGTSAKANDLLTPDRFPVYETGRGGEFTYHGPGQRVIYVMLDIKRRTNDVRSFVALLETWLIAVLASFGVSGRTREERVGVWVERPALGKGREDKIAAIGIRVRRWVSFHGMSLNVEPDLEHFSGIVPCGIRGYGTTSLADLGARDAGMNQVDDVLRTTFQDIIGGALYNDLPPV